MVARAFVPGVVSVVFSGNFGDGHNWVNKLHVGYTGGPPIAADLDAYALALSNAYIAGMTPLQPLATSLLLTEVTDLSSAVGAVGLKATASAGTRVGLELPGNACALASYKVARHYRGGHPRSYLPVGTAPDLANQSTWLDTFVTAVTAGWGTVLAALAGPPVGLFAPTGLVNVSYFGGAPPVAGHSVPRLVPIVDPIIFPGVVISHEIATQRRRIGR